jgi:hypothetical protein
VNIRCSSLDNRVSDKMKTIGFGLSALQVLLSLSEKLLVNHSSQLNEKQARLVVGSSFLGEDSK